MSTTNEERVGLPPLSAARRSTWERYRLEFLADGYPGRRVDGALRPHPVYGTYVITDYLGQYQRTQDRAFLRAAERVADAAVDRMEARGDAIVFRYKPHTGISAVPHDHYAGLTQSRYLAVLGRLDATTGGHRFTEARSSILRSLVLPAHQGGVARRTPGGHLALEERSDEVPGFALSGWASMTTLVHEYASTCGDDNARQLAEDSLRGIAELLPHYDVGDLALSRDRLSGQAALRLSLQQPGARVLDGWIDMPGHGRLPLQHDPDRRPANRWVSGVDEQGRLERTTGGLDVVLCRAAWPRPHTLHLEIEVPEASRYAVKIGRGAYDPTRPSMPVEDWAVVVRGELGAGRNVLDVAVPWHLAELVAYPSTFTTPVGAERVNTTHFEHVDALRRLLKVLPDPAVEYFHHRWASYAGRWPSVPELQVPGLSLARPGA